MREETIHFFTDREEEFLDLLASIGIRITVAKLLVFFNSTGEATQREMERKTDLRQPEVSFAIKYMVNQGWLKWWELPPENRGRPYKKYALNIPITDIITKIEKEKKMEAKSRIALVKKMREYT